MMRARSEFNFYSVLKARIPVAFVGACVLAGMTNPYMLSVFLIAGYAILYGPQLAARAVELR